MPKQLYKTYVFRNKDPVIDQLRTLVRDAALDLRQVANASGVSETTLYAWFYGITRRPQFATIQAVARALGHEYTLTKA